MCSLAEGTFHKSSPFLPFIVAGQLEHLQGSCIPVMRTAGYWHGMFVVVTDYISGAHTLEELLVEGTPLPADLSEEATKVLIDVVVEEVFTITPDLLSVASALHTS